MLTQEQLTTAQQRAYEYLTRAGIVLTEQERANIEVADLGLGDLTHTGLELINDKRRSPRALAGGGMRFLFRRRLSGRRASPSPALLS